MSNNRAIRNIDSLFSALGLLITIFIIVKACSIGITDDEAWSYYNVKRFWYVETLCTGNTHWFNFLAIKSALLLGLEKAWQLRWLSVLSAIAFIMVCILWIKTIKELVLKCFAFSFLLLNPYLLDYLCLARGYGSGLAFMGLSLLFLFKSLTDEKRKYGLIAFLFAGLSAIANFNFFYYFLSFVIVYFLKEFYNRRLTLFKSKIVYIELLYFSGITFLVLRALLFIRNCSNDIGGFGGESFIHSVFGSYISKGFIDNNQNQIATVLYYLFFAVILSAALFGILGLKKHRNHFYFLTSAMLLMMLSLTVFNKYCFHVLYPQHRATLMFYPLYALVLINGLYNLKIKRTIFLFFLYSISGALSFNYFYQFSLKQTIDYSLQADSKAVYQTLLHLKAKHIGVCPELYFLYLKYYSVVNPSLKGDMINTMVPIPFWLQKKENRLDQFDYLILYPPYNLYYYKNSKVKLQGVALFPVKKTLIVKVEKK